MPAVTLTPVVTDDGWGGALAYAWTQVTGPDTATIGSPTALSTLLTLSSVGGAYLFRITVTRADDGLVGTGLWSVYVFATASAIPPDDEMGAVVLTVDGLPTRVLDHSVQIQEGLGQPDVCSCTLYGQMVALFNDVILERGLLRLFGGVCLSIQHTIEAAHVLTHLSLVGYAWHFGRVRVTKTYDALSISAIAADLLAMAPGGITGEFIAADLPIATLVLEGVTILEAFAQLTQIERGLHVRVDHYKRLHVAITEIDGEAVEVSPVHPPLMEGLSITTDGSQVVNRVIVTYDQVVTHPVLVDAEIAVDSLEGYSPAGGDTVINGNAVQYTGTRSEARDGVYGQVGVTLVIRRLPIGVIGSPAGLDPDYVYRYGVTLVTALGESPLVLSSSPTTGTGDFTYGQYFGISLATLTGDPAKRARVTGINLYRFSTEPGNDAWIYVATLPVTPGAGFLDAVPFATLVADMAPTRPPTVNTADEMSYFLTGCSGSQDVHTVAQVMVEDTAAQAALATALGGGDDGVIEAGFDGGSITEGDATHLATLLLAQSIDPRIALTCRLRNDRAHPGQRLALSFPPPLDVDADLKIQQATLAGFEPGIPTEHSITAATEIVLLEDLLRHGASGPGASVSRSHGGGSSSAGSGGITGAAGSVGPAGATGPAGAAGATGADGADGAPGAPGAPGAGGVWGAITGTLSAQTDLGTALAGKATLVHTHAEADVTGLVADLALKAPLASPALTGTPTAPTAAPGTNTTQIASTAFVVAADALN